jgi:hypothetical protein
MRFMIVVEVTKDSGRCYAGGKTDFVDLEDFGPSEAIERFARWGRDKKVVTICPVAAPCRFGAPASVYRVSRIRDLEET